MIIMPYYIAFDTAHKPRGKIDENFTELRDFLNAHEFISYNFLETPITREVLKPYDVLVFICPDFAKINRQEIMEIEAWVKEDGGGLLILSHAGGDKGRGSNLTELSEQFGMRFENDQVLDETKNIGMENMPIISTFNPPHPITNNLKEICYRAGCSLTIMGPAISIAYSNDSSTPFSCALICVSEQVNGRVCAIGSYEMFRDKTGGGFQNDQHPDLALNVFKWLISDYRVQLRSGAKVITPPQHAENAQPQVATVPSINATSPQSQESQAINIDFSIKISNKSELMELLKIFANQINTVKTTIDKLIEKVSASDGEIAELKKPQAVETPIPTIPQSSAPVISEQIAPINETKTKDYKELYELKEPPLSALPPRPPSLLKKIPEAKADLTEEEMEGYAKTEAHTEEIPAKEEVKAAPEEQIPIKEKAPSKEQKKTGPTKEDLSAEKESLESKLKSNLDLVSFIERKHETGKLDDKAYEKQIKKLQKDVDACKKRIEEINKLL